MDVLRGITSASPKSTRTPCRVAGLKRKLLQLSIPRKIESGTLVLYLCVLFSVHGRVRVLRIKNKSKDEYPTLKVFDRNPIP
jgi:hypothetical protein